ncbi:hypothetical protein GXW82_15565 [Streptacidiphilus sp. 4-A2]|nr:hypothetical protein [Streptacidiphilus sp. 4-A2]
MGAYRDPLHRRWLRTVVETEADGEQWLRNAARGWADGIRFSFAVLEQTGPGAGFGPPIAHMALNLTSGQAGSAEVGYWTSAQGRGRGLARGRWPWSRTGPSAWTGSPR